MKDALERYPKTFEGGITVRPLRASDAGALAAFFRRVPIDECRLFKDDVRDPDVLRGWCRKPDYRRVLPLLAWKGRRVVGDATLHRLGSGWSRHVARIRLTLADELFLKNSKPHKLVLPRFRFATAEGIQAQVQAWVAANTSA